MSTNQKTPGLWTMPKGALEKSVQKLEAAIVKRGGNPVSIFDRFRTDKSFTDRLAEWAVRGGVEGSAHHKLARALMGKNIWGLEEWALFHNVHLTKKQERAVSEFPWGEDILNSPCPFVKNKTIWETHFSYLGLTAVNGKPFTIMHLQELYPASGQSKFYSYAPSAWFSEHEFAKETTLSFRWYLMLKNIVPNSTSIDFATQQPMLPPEYEVPLCVEEVAKDLLLSHKIGIYSNKLAYARCRDVSASGDRLHAGYFDGDGLDVRDWRDYARSLVGLAASRKVPS